MDPFNKEKDTRTTDEKAADEKNKRALDVERESVKHEEKTRGENEKAETSMSPFESAIVFLLHHVANTTGVPHNTRAAAHLAAIHEVHPLPVVEPVHDEAYLTERQRLADVKAARERIEEADRKHNEELAAETEKEKSDRSPESKLYSESDPWDKLPQQGRPVSGNWTDKPESQPTGGPITSSQVNKPVEPPLFKKQG